jgi:hypothetical protein
MPFSRSEPERDAMRDGFITGWLEVWPWLNRALLFGALVWVFTAGINAATHHWWDAAGELLCAALFLWLRTVKIRLSDEAREDWFDDPKSPLGF